MEYAIPLIVALLIIAVIWKMFKGIAKTVALVGLLVIAAIYVFGFGGLA
jgi:hypothetical protein